MYIAFWLLERPSSLSLSTINMANIWQIRGAPYGAQWRVPTNFILYIFALMLVLLSYRRLDPRSSPTFEKIAFNYRYVMFRKFRSSAGGIFKKS